MVDERGYERSDASVYASSNSYGKSEVVAIKARPITREYRQLGHQMGELDEQIGQLEMLLQPILSPEREALMGGECASGPPRDTVSEFAEQIRGDTDRLTSITQRVIRLQNRLEISA